MKTLLELAQETDAAIGYVYSAFGAPGHWGDGHPQGDSLSNLYRLQAEIRTALAAQPSGER